MLLTATEHLDSIRFIRSIRGPIPLLEVRRRPLPYSSTPISRISIFMSSQVSFFADGFRSKYAGW